MKERLNYIKSGKYFVGVPTNIKGVIIQAKSLKELKIKSKVLCNIALKHMVDVINQEGECFDLFEVESLNKN